MQMMTARDRQNAVWRQYLTQAAQGDELAFAAFYDETGSLAYGLALKLLGNSADAEDLVLDAYLQVWRSAAAFNPDRGTPLTWLLMIVRSRAVDRLRVRRPAAAPEDSLALVASPDASPAQTCELRQLVTRLQAALHRLPASLRHLLELAYFQGLSHAEIAAGTGQPLGTVKTRIRRALQLLRDSLAAPVEA